MANNAICSLCGRNPVSAARTKATGYTHCTAHDCVAEWRRRRNADGGFVLVAVHKQGPQWIKSDEVKKNDMTRQGGVR